MKRKSIYFIVLILLIILFLFDTIIFSSEISIDAKIDKNSIPQNKNIILNIILNWKTQNDTNLEIIDNVTPELSNLEITEVKTKVNSYIKDTVNYKEKIFTYHLKPLEIGMAYIEQVPVKFRTSSRINKIFTPSRLKIQITDPVYQKKPFYRKKMFYIIISGIVLFIILIILIKYIIKRKNRQNEVTEQISLETEILNKISGLNNFIKNEDFENFTVEYMKLLQRYILEKFDINYKILSKEEIVKKIKELNVNTDEFYKIIEDTENVKFAGMTLQKDKMEDYKNFLINFVKQNENQD